MPGAVTCPHGAQQVADSHHRPGPDRRIERLVGAAQPAGVRDGDGAAAGDVAGMGHDARLDGDHRHALGDPEIEPTMAGPVVGPGSTERAEHRGPRRHRPPPACTVATLGACGRRSRPGTRIETFERPTRRRRGRLTACHSDPGRTHSGLARRPARHHRGGDGHGAGQGERREQESGHGGQRRRARRRGGRAGRILWTTVRHPGPCGRRGRPRRPMDGGATGDRSRRGPRSPRHNFPARCENLHVRTTTVVVRT